MLMVEPSRCPARSGQRSESRSQGAEFRGGGGSTRTEQESQTNPADVGLVAGHRLAGEVLIIVFVPRPRVPGLGRTEVPPGRLVACVRLEHLEHLGFLAPVCAATRRGPPRGLGL